MKIEIEAASLDRYKSGEGRYFFYQNFSLRWNIEALYFKAIDFLKVFLDLGIGKDKEIE